ncbi:hypothetical protein EYV94_18215 [Puteibacter caeruleilacunae]|nr:hypothetical protein EYV94_18215 [Puteibacter caeruleilacunae]
MNTQTIKQYLDKILSSDTLRRSALSCRLLQFLVDATLSDEIIKEYTIGVHLFGEDFDLEKSGSKVRVKVYQLRQYLDKYYASEGKDDSIRFEIEKGQYSVSFIEGQGNNREEGNKRFMKPRFIAVCAAAVLAIAAALWLLQDNEVAFWDEFFQGDQSTVLAIGDVFTFYGPAINDDHMVVRDFDINDERDFLEYMKEHPELDGKFTITEYSYLSQMTPYATHSLSKLFYEHEHDLDIMMGSNMGIDMIKTNHTIFVGMPKTLGLLAPLLNEINDSRIQLKEDKITYKESKDAPLKKYGGYTQNDIDTDYAMVACFKKPGGKKAFIFVSDHDVGIIGAVDYFTNPDSLTEVQAMLPPNTKYFAAIVKATGMDRSELGIELVHVEPISE